MFTCVMISILIGICPLQIDSVTSVDPCDPQYNATVQELYSTEEMEIILVFESPSWMKLSLVFVNCSARGLTVVPSKVVPHNVEILDLSFNAILHLTATDFDKFPNLVVLWMPYNCPRNPKLNLPICMTYVNISDESMSTLSNLKLLNLANSILPKFPKKLSSTIQFIDVSQTAIPPLDQTDVGHFNNLSVFVAKDVCLHGITHACKTRFHIKPQAFKLSNESLRVLSVAENDLSKTAIDWLSYPNLLSVNFAKSLIHLRGNVDFQKLPKLRHLSLQQLHRDGSTHEIMHDHTFDSLVGLQFLDLSNNYIDYMPDTIFQFNQNLTYINLAGNCLRKSVQDPTFLQVESLKYVYLGFNFCYRSVPKFANVKRHNVHLKLGPTFTKLINLEILNFGSFSGDVFDSFDIIQRALNFNTVKNQSLSVLKDLKKLRQLSLGFCQIRNIDFSVFQELEFLTFLDISNNHLEDLKLVSDTFRSDFHGYNRKGKKTENKYTRITSFLVGSIKTFRLNSDQNVCNENYLLDLSSNALPNIHQTMFSDNFSSSYFTTRLDLSFNVIQSIRDNSFKCWPKLCFVDLRDNPINYIHKHAFSQMYNLKHLLLNNTQLYIHSTTLYFLKNIKSHFNLQWWSGRYFFNFKPKGATTKRFPFVKTIDFSNNFISSEEILVGALLPFSNVLSITLRRCFISTNNFALRNPLVRHLDMSENSLPNLPLGTLTIMPNLTHLLLSRNQIRTLPEYLFNITPNLQMIDLAYNHIGYISNEVFKSHSNNLSVLLLQNNYLTQVSINNLPLQLLNQLSEIDLRWNSLTCSCELTEHFGRWLTNISFALASRPGMLPFCAPLIDTYFGGCVACPKQNSLVYAESSLISYCGNKSCQASSVIRLCVFFCGVILMFMVLVRCFTSLKWKKWFTKKALHHVINYEIETTKILGNQVYAFHACICFDLCDNKLCDWVDYHLVPNLQLHCRLTVTGRDDQCGISPVQQLLLKIEASRKVLFLLTKDFVNSNEGRYILSALEYLEYKYGTDRLVILKFEDDKHTGGLLQKRTKCRPWSVFNVSNDYTYWPLLWSNLIEMLNPFC